MDKTESVTSVGVPPGENGMSSTAPLGVFRGVIDLDNLTAELIPSRNASKIGDVFDTDITQFLLYSPCWNCARVQHVESMPGNRISIGLAIKHPISNIAARPDLHVFDTRGIMILPADTNFSIEFPPPGDAPLESLDGNAFTLTNADGMTTHFDEIPENPNYFNPPIDIPGNLNPYRNYFQDVDTAPFDPHAPAGYNVFPVGSDWQVQDYILDTTTLSGVIEFIFIIDASYGHSAVLANRQNPQYYLPQFNRKEAWRVDVGIVQNGLKAKDANSGMWISIEVFDWQGSRTIDPAYPDPTHLSGIPYESDVNGVRVSVPALFNGEKTIDTPESGSGAWGDPYKYNLIFFNELKANVGKYAGLVCVRDDIWNTDGPYGIPPNPNGFPFEGPNLKDYAAYKCFLFEIADPLDLEPDPFPGEIHVDFGHGLAVGDFNGDSIDDLAISAPGAEPSGSVFVYFGDGEKLVEPPLQLYSDDISYDELGYRVAVGKINDDEYDDIVTDSEYGAMVVFLSDGTGGFLPAIGRKDGTEMMGGFGWYLCVGNVTNDTYGEIVTCEPYYDFDGEINSGRVLIYTFDGSSLPAPIQFSYSPTTNNKKFGHSVALAKINSDDLDDIIVLHDAEIFPGQYYDFQYMYSDGSGGIYGRTSLREKFPMLNSVTLGNGISTEDLNGDGIQEWVIGAEMNSVNGITASGEFFIFYPDGYSGFNGYARYHSDELNANERMGGPSFSFGDFNGDGGLDIVSPATSANSTQGSAHVFLASPGGYSFYKRYVEPSLDIAHYYIFGISSTAMDIDGNGDDELIIASDSENWRGHVYVYFDP
jgi:hypothetical protein